MVLTYIWTGMVLSSLLFSLWTGSGRALSPAILDGAQAGIAVSLSIAGSLCLWSGLGKAMEKAGITGLLAHVFSPLLSRIYPSFRKDPAVGQAISANFCANLLGLGNAATPMGIQAVKRLGKYASPGVASKEMCRLIIMNTASVQLIPANVAALRAANGCSSPFDILPAVWLTSIASVSAGLLAAFLLDRRRP